jgi:hypothetical protein
MEGTGLALAARSIVRSIPLALGCAALCGKAVARLTDLGLEGGRREG